MANDPHVRIAELEAENRKLKEENAKLKQELAEKNRSLKFLSEEQIKNSSVDRKPISKWLNKSVREALKLRFTVGKFGYGYLRSMGYPCPAYSTLNCRVRSINMNFGIIDSIMHAMKNKVSHMLESDRWCTLMVDEMEISSSKDLTPLRSASSVV